MSPWELQGEIRANEIRCSTPESPPSPAVKLTLELLKSNVNGSELTEIYGAAMASDRCASDRTRDRE